MASRIFAPQRLPESVLMITRFRPVLLILPLLFILLMVWYAKRLNRPQRAFIHRTVWIFAMILLAVAAVELGIYIVSLF